MMQSGGNGDLEPERAECDSHADTGTTNTSEMGTTDEELVIETPETGDDSGSDDKSTPEPMETDEILILGMMNQHLSHWKR